MTNAFKGKITYDTLGRNPKSKLLKKKKIYKLTQRRHVHPSH